MITGSHYGPFYEPWARNLQRRFLDHWLKGVDGGLDADAPIMLAIRDSANGFVWRRENEWPLARTDWTRLHLDADSRSLSEGVKGSATATIEPGTDGGSIRFTTPPFEAPTEITGPMMLKLWVSSAAEYIDLFATVRMLRADGVEATLVGANTPAAPGTQGWLRASQRELDPTRTTPYRPWHRHDRIEPLPKDAPTPLEMEVWPTSMVFGEGEKLVFEVSRNDPTGAGMFRHAAPAERPAPAGFRIHTGGNHDSHLLAPVIPSTAN